jgi:GNAT superfamily N-acetyltransferase
MKLGNPTEAELADAVQQNLFDLFRSMARTLPGGECEESATVCRHFSFPTNPMFKGAWAPRLAEEDADRVIDETIDWFEARKAPYFFFWTGPDTAPADLGARLSAHGLLDMAEQQTALATGVKQTELGAPTMALEVSRADESLLAAVPAGFCIEEVRTDADLEDFKRVFVETYGIPEWAGQAWLDATRAVGIGSAPWRMFIGRLDGRAVATNMLFCGGGVASVYAVATLADARGKGIGGAITLSPLIEARRQGYEHAVLFSTEMGVRAYERIGFRTVPGRINRYLWRAGRRGP